MSLAQTAIPRGGSNRRELPDLAADRPGFGDPPNVLPAGVVQMEGGFLYRRYAAENRSLWSVGSPTLRFGMGHRLEFRVGGDGFYLDGVAHGFSDHSIGLKYRVANEKTWRPMVSAIGSVSTPVGDPAWSSASWDPRFKIAASKQVPGDIEISGVWGSGRIPGVGGRWWQNEAAIAAGRSLGERWGVYGELYREGAPCQSESGAWLASGGLTRMIGRNLQLDWEAGRSVRRSEAGWFLAAGFALRRLVWE
jgi:hypothetical protein